MAKSGVEYISQWPPEPVEEDAIVGQHEGASRLPFRCHEHPSSSSYKSIRKDDDCSISDCSEERELNVPDNSRVTGDRNDEENDSSDEEMALTSLAVWYRRTSGLRRYTATSSSNPVTQLHILSRTEPGQKFLWKKVEEVGQHLRHVIHLPKKAASCYARLASFHELLGELEVASNLLEKSILLHNRKKYQWMLIKVQRQADIKKCQLQALKTIENRLQTLHMPAACPVARRSAKDLTVQEFESQYKMTRTPLVITNLLEEMVEEPWNMDFVCQMAGDKLVTLKKHVSESVEWAKLEAAQQVKVVDFIHSITTDAKCRSDANELSNLYLFDWSLTINCPEMAQRFKVPSYFSGDYLKLTEPGTLYHDSWPSLFVGPAGTHSELHVDAFGSNFWMALFQGQKRWLFFRPEDMPYLYPVYFQALDPTFDINLDIPDLKRHPLLSLTRPMECILEPGELLFVPAGSPHRVENLEASVAVSSNFVDQSNIGLVEKELKINGMIDDRACALLEEFKRNGWL